MSVAVVIPFRGGCVHREAALRWVAARYGERHPSWELIVSELPQGEPWRKGVAVSAGVARCDRPIVVVVDSDVWSERLETAVELVRAGAPWAMPFTRVARLNERATNEVLGGEDLAEVAARRRSWAERPYTQSAAGGIVVLPRSTALSIPIDARFTGWGQEDEAWRDALETLAGRRSRVEAILFHLFHPPQPRISRAVGSPESLQLRRLYSAARGNPALMRALLVA